MNASRLLWFSALVAMCITCPVAVNSEGETACSALNDCNGHGRCNADTKTCECILGFGAVEDIASYKAPDCSTRTCPSGKAWTDTATGRTKAHAQAECSAMGLCNRISGECRCFAGFAGTACQRTVCPNDCSGHGRCVSMRQMAAENNAVPIRPPSTYSSTHETWDEDKLFGCVCDSVWDVGLGNDKTQATTWFGTDCSLRRCPSGDDPGTRKKDELDCSYMLDNGETYKGAVDSDGKPCYEDRGGKTSKCTLPSPAPQLGIDAGAAGNKCHNDCSGRGTCNFGTGVCTCFQGWTSTNCGTRSIR